MPRSSSPGRKRAKDPSSEGLGPVPEDNEPGHRAEVLPDKPLVPPQPYRVDSAAERTADELDELGDSVRFPFLFEPLFVPLAAVLGVVPATTWL